MSARVVDLEKERDAAKASVSMAAATETPVRSASSAADTTAVAGASGDNTVSLTDAEADLAGADAEQDTSGGDDPEIMATDADRPDALAAPQGEKGDLKLLSGVGPKPEGVPNGLGVFHFWQIAK